MLVQVIKERSLGLQVLVVKNKLRMRTGSSQGGKEEI